jgi:hypothetical protein
MFGLVTKVEDDQRQRFGFLGQGLGCGVEGVVIAGLELVELDKLKNYNTVA